MYTYVLLFDISFWWHIQHISFTYVLNICREMITYVLKYATYVSSYVNMVYIVIIWQYISQNFLTYVEGYFSSSNIADICCSYSTYTFDICIYPYKMTFQICQTCIYLTHMSHHTLIEKICQHTVLHMLIPCCIFFTYVNTWWHHRHYHHHLSKPYSICYVLILQDQNLMMEVGALPQVLAPAGQHHLAAGGVVYLLRQCW